MEGTFWSPTWRNRDFLRASMSLYVEVSPVNTSFIPRRVTMAQKKKSERWAEAVSI